MKEEESSTPPTSLGHSGMEAYVAIEGILLSVEPKNKNKRKKRNYYLKEINN